MKVPEPWPRKFYFSGDCPWTSITEAFQGHSSSACSQHVLWLCATGPELGRQVAGNHSPLSQRQVCPQGLSLPSNAYGFEAPSKLLGYGFALSQNIKHYLISCLVSGLPAKGRLPMGFLLAISRGKTEQTNKCRTLQP